MITVSACGNQETMNIFLNTYARTIASLKKKNWILPI